MRPALSGIFPGSDVVGRTSTRLISPMVAAAVETKSAFLTTRDPSLTAAPSAELVQLFRSVGRIEHGSSPKYKFAYSNPRGRAELWRCCGHFGGRGEAFCLDRRSGHSIALPFGLDEAH